jgi:hypothetical protein
MATDLEGGRNSSHDAKLASNEFDSDEKRDEVVDLPQQIEAAIARDEALPDPDAGLSEEERKKIVSDSVALPCVQY